MAGVSVPMVNFGNSDDRGKNLILGVKKTHLFHLKKMVKIEDFQTIVYEHFAGNDPVIEILLPI